MVLTWIYALPFDIGYNDKYFIITYRSASFQYLSEIKKEDGLKRILASTE